MFTDKLTTRNQKIKLNLHATQVAKNEANEGDETECLQNEECGTKKRQWHMWGKKTKERRKEWKMKNHKKKRKEKCKQIQAGTAWAWQRLCDIFVSSPGFFVSGWLCRGTATLLSAVDRPLAPKTSTLAPPHAVAHDPSVRNPLPPVSVATFGVGQ
jgi:hypothetical protein